MCTHTLYDQQRLSLCIHGSLQTENISHEGRMLILVFNDSLCANDLYEFVHVQQDLKYAIS